MYSLRLNLLIFLKTDISFYMSNLGTVSLLHLLTRLPFLKVPEAKATNALSRSHNQWRVGKLGKSPKQAVPWTPSFSKLSWELGPISSAQRQTSATKGEPIRAKAQQGEVTCSRLHGAHQNQNPRAEHVLTPGRDLFYLRHATADTWSGVVSSVC